MNYGIIPQPQKSKNFIAGWITSLPQEPINPSGDWRPYLPAYETQNKGTGFDTMSCVSFAALNTLETLHKFRYQTEMNWSDRFTAKMSGTTVRGNWFTQVWDSIRKDGLVPEEDWPYEGDSWTEYHSIIPEDIVTEGLRASGRYEIGYEFIAFTSLPNLRAGLKRGPLEIAIGTEQNPSYHAITLAHIDDDDNRWVFDHYPSPIGGEKKGLYILPEHLNINAALRPHFKKTSKDPMPISLPNDCLVTGVLDHGLTQALHLNGKLLLDPDDKNQAFRQWVMRNEDNGFFRGGPVRSISKEDWEGFTITNFKGEII